MNIIKDSNDKCKYIYKNMDDVIFVDIETTGLSRYYSYITMIGWIKNGVYKYYIKGSSPDEFIKDMETAKGIVTFNGSMFDIPFIKTEFKNINVPEVHLDLRFFTKRFGYTGGQKIIEDMLDIKRTKNLKGVDGKYATVLWYETLKGKIKSFEKLIEYNYHDVYNMLKILDIVTGKHLDILKSKQLNMFDENFVKFTKSKVKCQFANIENEMAEAKKYVKKNINKFTFEDIKVKDKRVIGIDLTGSEKKASGVALMDGNNVSTRLILTDQEMIEYILNEKPDVVSIDSPLSLPTGRTMVTDDDPTRYEFGIMRYTERELKRRGVSVYPCLIFSMQRLTERGIKLSHELRNLGISVIESFPGAAQDVLSIPRKRTDLNSLKDGLIDFGLKGEYEKVKISHDELDAITSALVGVLYLSDQYEGVGNEEEGYIIIPKFE